MAGYCDTDDVASILSEHGVTAFTDDDLDGITDGTLTQDAIDRTAALYLDFPLSQRYQLSALTSNEWCRWANAIVAAVAVTERRNMPGSQSLIAERQMILDQLAQIASGARQLPGAGERFDHLPCVTNYHIERWRADQPARVVQERSTGAAPETPVKRWPSRPFRVSS